MNKIFIVIFTLLFVPGLWSQETSVLFIGNSFTFMNDMPFMFRDIAASNGRNVHVDTVIEGGKDFKYHASNPETYQVIRSRKWDYVIIQGHSNELTHPDPKVDANSLPFARQIVDSIRGNSMCTQVILYMTWGYKNGNAEWSAINTYELMQQRIRNQYLRFADLLDTRVSPVGEVWKSLRANYPELNLYHPDKMHPSIYGSYAAACTFYAAVFGESPLRNSAILPIEPNVRQIIEYTASQVVLNNLSEWRFVQRATDLSAGFDMFLSGCNLQVYDRSQNASWVEWDFGDGHISSEKEPVHVYKSAGTYEITQRVSMYCKTTELTRTIEIR